MNQPILYLTLGAIALALTAWLLWPEKGLLWRWQAARKVTRRVQIEDALKHIHNRRYLDRNASVQSVAGVLQISSNEAATLLQEMHEHGLIEYEGDKLGLTPQGRDYALQIIRAHRLWERYLADKTGYPEADWHNRSEQLEHRLSAEEVDALSSQLGHPRYDPHGDPIPTADGDLVPPQRRSLPNFPIDEPGVVVHLEDEPDAVYAQLIAEGLHLGMTVRVTEITPQRIRFWADGDEHVLAPVVATNISVAPVPAEAVVEPEESEMLTTLKSGQTARVCALSRALRGTDRRRLMDLGILPGTIIKAEMTSPSGDPTAYLVRGALIGLRQEQARHIRISRELEPQPVPAMEAVV